MTPDPKLDEALDDLDGPGTVEVDHDGRSAEVDVVDVDRIGVRVKGVRVRHDGPVDVQREAEALPDRLRSLPDSVGPIEVAPELGGAILRGTPDRERRYFEVDVQPDRTDIRRKQVDDDGERSETDWSMTRDQLERLIDEVSPDQPTDIDK
ncbi:MAG: hypothetical protein AAF211_31160 [Myxococcota bacterium]